MHIYYRINYDIQHQTIISYNSNYTNSGINFFSDDCHNK